MVESAPIRALVVDDEPHGRDVVRTFLQEVEAVQVVGEARNGEEAVEMVRELQPDLLFLDIQMPDIDGFGVLDRLGEAVPPGIVLVTAHDEYAHQAFEVHAVDYVMKPFGRPRFMAAVERAIRRARAEDALGMRDTLRSLVESLRPMTSLAAATLVDGPESGNPESRRIGVRTGTRTVLIDASDIDWIEADRDLVRLHTGDKTHLISGRMKDLEARLSLRRFQRIHRSAIVNLDRVRVLDRDRDGGGAVVLASGVRLRVARGRWDDLEKALGLDIRG